MSKQLGRIILTLAVLVALNGVGVQPRAQAAPMQNTAVIQFGGPLGFHYSPSEVTIQPGDTVEWQGDFSMHPLVSDDGLWPTHNSGSAFTHTFPTTGTFLFHCNVHGLPGGVGMSGKIIVKELPFKTFLPLVLR